MKQSRRGSDLFFFLAWTLWAVAGCGPIKQPTGPEPLPAPTAEEVLAVHNAWADSIEHIWARADLRLNVPKRDGSAERKKFDLDGHLFLQKPDNLFLHGEVLGQDQFTLGASEERFWLWVRPQVNTVWTGRRGGPGERRLVLSPSALAEALGVFRVAPSEDLEQRCALHGEHMVLSEYRRDGGAAVRRIWFDRRTSRPARIDLFDESGRRLLMAELLRYERVGEIEVCTAYRARFYGNGEEMDLVLRLKEVNLDKKPNPRVFEYRVPPGAAEKDLDEEEDLRKE